MIWDTLIVILNTLGQIVCELGCSTSLDCNRQCFLGDVHLNDKLHRVNGDTIFTYYLNSALYCIQKYLIPPEWTAIATHYHQLVPLLTF